MTRPRTLRPLARDLVGARLLRPLGAARVRQVPSAPPPPPPTWSPDDGNSFAVWDPDAASSVFQDVARTVPAVFLDDPVASLFERTPAGLHLTQATDANRFVLRPGATPSGRAVVQSLGGSSRLSTTFGLHVPQPCVLVMVVQLYAFDVDGYLIKSNIAVQDVYQANGAGLVRALAPSEVGLVQTTALADHAFHVVGVYFNGAASFLSVDGGAHIAGDLGSTGEMFGLILGGSLGSNFPSRTRYGFICYRHDLDGGTVDYDAAVAYAKTWAGIV